MSRRYWGIWKSVLHFDFPHYYAENSGLKDEASPETWHLSGNAALASRFSPATVSNSNAPKFGYRSLITYSQSDYAFASNTHDTFSFDIDEGFSAGVFVWPNGSSEGGIIQFMNGESLALSLSMTAERKLKADCSEWNLGATSSTVLSLNAWHYVFMAAQKGTFSVWVDGTLAITNSSPSKTLKVTRLRIGGCPAMFDEFSYGRYSTNYAIPSQPLQAALDMTQMGGFGTGKDGDLAWGNASGFSVNTAGLVKSVSGLTFSVPTRITASYGTKTFSAGDEVMIHVRQNSKADPYSLAGLYEFRRVVDYTGSSITIDREIESFDIDEALRDYSVVLCKVPNFKTVTITAGFLRPVYDILAFRATGGVHWGGGTYFYPAKRYDPLNLSHSDLPDRMINSGLNMLVFCGGTFTAPATGRIGEQATKKIYRESGYGGGGGDEGQVMIGTSGSYYYGPNLLIAARKLAIDQQALQYGGRSANAFSGLCYLAGVLS